MNVSRKTVIAAAAVIAAALIAIIVLLVAILSRDSEKGVASAAPSATGSPIPSSSLSSAADAKRQTCEGFYDLQNALNATPLVGISADMMKTDPAGVQHAIQVRASANDAFAERIDDRGGAAAVSARKLVSATRINININTRTPQSSADVDAATSSLLILCAPYKK